MKHEELSIVCTTRDIPEYGLKKGARGTVLEVYNAGEGYDVEFKETTDPTHVVTLFAADIETAPPLEDRIAPR